MTLKIVLANTYERGRGLGYMRLCCHLEISRSLIGLTSVMVISQILLSIFEQWGSDRTTNKGSIMVKSRVILWRNIIPKMVGWLVVFNVPSTARTFRDGTPIYCPLRRTCSSINTPFRPGIEPRAVAWQSITLPLRYASSTYPDKIKALMKWQPIAFICKQTRPITSGPDLCHSATYRGILYYLLRPIQTEGGWAARARAP